MDTNFRKSVRLSIKILQSQKRIDEIKERQLTREIKTLEELIEDNQNKINECDDVKVVKDLHELDVFYRETKGTFEEVIRHIQENSQTLENVSNSLNRVAYYDEDERKEPEENNEYIKNINTNEEIKQNETLVEPTNARYWSERALDEAGENKFEEALQSYEKAIEIEPTNARYWARKGYLEAYLEKFEEALQSYEKAIENINSSFEKDPNNIQTLEWKKDLPEFEKMIEGIKSSRIAQYNKDDWIDYENIHWFEKQIKSTETISDKFEKESLKEDLQREFAEEWIEEFEEEE